MQRRCNAKGKYSEYVVHVDFMITQKTINHYRKVALTLGYLHTSSCDITQGHNFESHKTLKR